MSTKNKWQSGFRCVCCGLSDCNKVALKAPKIMAGQQHNNKSETLRKSEQPVYELNNIIN